MIADLLDRVEAKKDATQLGCPSCGCSWWQGQFSHEHCAACVRRIGEVVREQAKLIAQYRSSVFQYATAACERDCELKELREQVKVLIAEIVTLKNT